MPLKDATGVACNETNRRHERGLLRPLIKYQRMRQARRFAPGWAIALLYFGGCGLPSPTVLSEFSTPLADRTPHQIRNAVKSAEAINGRTLQPGRILSFNETVGVWSRGRGFMRAPVSVGGMLVPSWGGGVCQTSTTLYGAALLAGLKIVERHPHAVAPSYVPSGLDAAVAPGVADLKIQNPFSFPVTVLLSIRGDRLICRVVAHCRRGEDPRSLGYRWVLRRELVAETPPAPVGRTIGRRPGRTVRLWRWTVFNGKVIRQELCHQTNYEPLVGVLVPSRD